MALPVLDANSQITIAQNTIMKMMPTVRVMLSVV
jgi:hypothetical protein